jgi:hypothetical protein
MRDIGMMTIDRNRDVWIKARDIRIAMMTNHMLIHPIVLWRDKDDEFTGELVHPGSL